MDTEIHRDEALRISTPPRNWDCLFTSCVAFFKIEIAAVVLSASPRCSGLSSRRFVGLQELGVSGGNCTGNTIRVRRLDPRELSRLSPRLCLVGGAGRALGEG